MAKLLVVRGVDTMGVDSEIGLAGPNITAEGKDNLRESDRGI